MSYDFLNYCMDLFPGKFRERVLNLTKLKLNGKVNSLELQVSVKQYELYGVIIVNNLRHAPLDKLRNGGLLILSQQVDKDLLDTNLLNMFEYHRLYYVDEEKTLLGLGINLLVDNPQRYNYLTENSPRNNSPSNNLLRDNSPPGDLSKEYIPDWNSNYSLNDDILEKRTCLVIYPYKYLSENVKYFIKHGIIKYKTPDRDEEIHYSGKLKRIDYIFFNRGGENTSNGDSENISANLEKLLGGYDNVNIEDQADICAAKAKEYDFIIWINDNVLGPFLAPWCPHNWVQILVRLLDYKTKLVGTTLAYSNYMAYINSNVLVTDKIGLDKLGENFSRKLFGEIEQDDKISISQKLLNEGYSVRPIISSYYNSEIKSNSEICEIHTNEDEYFGSELHPYDVIFIHSGKSTNPVKEYQIHSTESMVMKHILLNS